MHEAGDPIRPTPSQPAGNTALIAVLVVVGISAMIFLYALFGPGLFFLILLGFAIASAGALHFWLWGRSMEAAEGEKTDDA